MIVEMKTGASQDQIDAVVDRAKGLGFELQMNIGTDKVVVAILGGHTGGVSTDVFAVLPGVETVTRIMKPYKLASKEFKHQKSQFSVGDVVIGGPRLAIIAGPCAVESEEQLFEAAQVARKGGASLLRGGIFKPRTSPFSFQGLEEEGYYLLNKLRKQEGMPVVTEVTDPHHVEELAKYADVLQVGARNMQNYSLLRELSRTPCPVLLKRGLCATVTEWLMAADYLLAEGNERVILCERGIRTFETSTRFTLDLGAIPAVRKVSHLPIVVDPSHAAGHFDLVPSLAKAAVAAGADGLLIELHPDPQNALCDGLQSLTPNDFLRLMDELKPIAEAVGRTI
jgi:3-deoxy-7-phosphoheptulonate synthase